MANDIGDGPLRAERDRQQELRERSIGEAQHASTPLEIAAIFGVAFAVPAMAAWGVVGLGLATMLGGVMWLFERRRPRVQSRERLAQFWRAIEDACCLDEVRDAARRALAELDASTRPTASGR